MGSFKEPQKNDGMNQDSKTDFLGAFEKKKITRSIFGCPRSVSHVFFFFRGGGGVVNFRIHHSRGIGAGIVVGGKQQGGE